MPEEINRMVTDSISNYFFTTSEFANQILRKTGIAEEQVFFVGNTMIDTLLFNIDKLKAPSFWSDMKLDFSEYFVLTMHRPANVDLGATFERMLNAIGEGSKGLPVIFPVHPRTAKTLKSLNNLPENLFLIDPQPYLEFNYLVKHAKAVITDSGGITEEATMMDIPCFTLRDSTERPETVIVGTNELIGTNPDNLKPAFERLFAGKWKTGTIPDKWDGKTGERIVEVLTTILC